MSTARSLDLERRRRRVARSSARPRRWPRPRGGPPSARRCGPPWSSSGSSWPTTSPSRSTVMSSADRQHLVEPVGDEQDAEALGGERLHHRRAAGSASLSVSTAVGSSKIRSRDVLLVDLARDLDELHVADRQPGDRQPLVDAEADQVERGARVAADARGGRRSRACGRRCATARLGCVGSRLSLMFSAIEKPGISMNSWCTMPMPGRHRVGRASRSAPSRPSSSDLALVAAGVADHGHAEQDVHQRATCRRRSRRPARGWCPGAPRGRRP